MKEVCQNFETKFGCQGAIDGKICRNAICRREMKEMTSDGSFKRYFYCELIEERLTEGVNYKNGDTPSKPRRKRFLFF